MNTVKIFNKLYRDYGAQGWWPLTLVKALSPITAHTVRSEHGVIYGIPWKIYHTLKTSSYDPYFDIAVGAILTQNTAWSNAAKALTCLAKYNLLTAGTIARAKPSTLEKYIRSTGYFKQKTKKLKLFAKYVQKKYKGDLRKLFQKNIDCARAELLSQWGIGKETADSILLYAGNKPICVVDTYTKRLCAEYGIVYKDYDEYQKLFMKDSSAAARHDLNLPAYYQEFHALMVQWGKDNS